VNDYVVQYINWLVSTTAKSPATILKERCSLNGWAKFLKDTRLNQITRKKINEYVVQRTAGDEGVSNRAANLDVSALGHMLKFARDEGLLKGDLPTEGWKPLKYTAPHRSLVPLDQIDKLCAEARAQVAGNPKYENGQFLSDYIYLLAFSGARRQAGVSLRWEQVDWSNRQLTLFTKFDKRVVVDFNEKLEAHLKDLFARRDPDSPWVFPTPRQGKKGTGYFANPQQLLEDVRKGAGMPNFHFHDCRHFFASFCVMSGLDTMTIASFLGHSDGGVLVGKVYGHLNPQHKREAAAKIRFTQTEAATPVVAREGTPRTVDLSHASSAELLAALQQKMNPKQN
jgi:integrase